jgi:DNA-binding IclR family transcriptional regulator
VVSFTRLSGQATTAVILTLAEQPATWWYGHELCQQLDLEPGRLYRALMRLADLGLSRPPGSPGRRRTGRRATVTG